MASPVVQTIYGPVEGFNHKTNDGSEINVFLGIPYAKPPVGELRFELPEPPEPWTTPLACKKFRHSAIPICKNWIQNEPFSEDCLYLNIISPLKPAETTDGYPVLVYIPGGGFNFGDVVKFGYRTLAEVIASKGVVVVTLPYRVGIFGFFNAGSPETRGNYGLWDQNLGLKFISSNIKQFGGNPQNVTLWGQSAGSASVGAHTLSPHSRDLFHKAICISGSVFSAFVTGNKDGKLTHHLAKVMGCKSNDPTEIKKFLKHKKWEDIFDASSNTEEFKIFPFSSKEDEKHLAWYPTEDDIFFEHKTFDQLVNEAPKKPTILGLMALEGQFFDYRGKTTDVAYLEDFIRNIMGKEAGPEATAIQDDIIKFFAHENVPSDANDEFYLRQQIDAFGDFFFNMMTFYEAEKKSSLGWPVYFHMITYCTEELMKNMGFLGTPHCYELFFVSDQVTYPFFSFGPNEIKIQKLYSDMYVNFVKTGNPQVGERFNTTNRSVLKITPDPVIESDPFSKRRKFWEQHVKKFKFNILRNKILDEQ